MSKSIITKATLFIVFLFSTIFLKTTAQNTFVYPTVKINNTEWGTENIRITKFKNGEPIPFAKTKKDWVDAAIAKKPIYEIENIENKSVYRYNFYVFMDKRGVIPNGFSLPTEKDIDDLAINLSENSTLIPKLKILPIGSKNFNRNNSTISFDPSTVGFWFLDESSSDMLTYDMGTSKVLFINNDCLDKFPAMCDGAFGRFETLYEAGGSDAGNGFCVRLIKKKNRIIESEPKESESTTGISKNENQNLTYQNSSNSQTIPQNSSNECDKIVEDYLVFARNAIAYYNGIKKNPETTSFNEYTNWDKEVRKQQDIVIKCVNKDISYGAKILDVMTELGTTMSSTSRISSSSFGSNNNSNSSSNNNTSNVCNYCAPSYKDGWHITDYNASNKTYPNSRYIKRPGYKPCETCQGTGDCRVTAGSNGPSTYPMICEGDGTCKKCNGDRFVKCSKCNGSGKSN